MYTITVLTVEGQPTFELPKGWLAPEVIEEVRGLYGAQASGSPHNWRGDKS